MVITALLHQFGYNFEYFIQIYTRIDILFEGNMYLCTR